MSDAVLARAVALVPQQASPPRLASLASRAETETRAAGDTLPTYDAQGGPDGHGAVHFDRDKQQFLNGGARSFDFTTHDGLTMVVLARLTGLAADGGYESIMYWLNANEQMSLMRNANTGEVMFNLGTSNNCVFSNDAITQTAWLAITVTFDYVYGWATVVVNTNTRDKSCNTRFDKHFNPDNTYVGKSPFNAPYLQGDVAGLFVVDAQLSVEEAEAILARMRAGLDTLGTCTACPAGKNMVGGECTWADCPEDEFRWNDQCNRCPVTKTSPIGSTSPLQCVCRPGYTSPPPCMLCPDDAECIACPPGTYKNATGAAACTPCAAGAYSAVSGRSSVCDPCTANSNSPASGTRDQCPCNAGAEPSDDGATCALCSAGSYKIPTGADPCTACTAGGHIATAGATANVCQCNAGWTGAQGAVCTECVAGTYKEGSGAASCVPCASGKFSPLVAAPLATTCVSCEAGKTTQGFAGRAAQSHCVECAAGTYTQLPEGNEECTSCPTDSASPQPGAISSAACAPCSVTQVAAANSSACTTCELGKFKSMELATCVSCLPKHFCAGGAPVPCDANSQTSPLERTDAASGGDCLCNTGYALRPFADYHTGAAVPSNACHPCPHGHYNSIVGVEECKACLAGRYVFANASTSISGCAECGANTFSAAGAGECTPCVDNSQGPRASGDARDCVCNAGFTGLPGGSCASCDIGKYKIEEG